MTLNFHISRYLQVKENTTTIPDIFINPSLILLTQRNGKLNILKEPFIIHFSVLHAIM